MKDVEIRAADSHVFIEGRGRDVLRVGLDREREALVLLPLGHLLDEEDVAFEAGVADGADAGALEHGLGRTREAQAMAPRRTVFGLSDARHRTDLLPDLRGRGRDLDRRVHRAELGLALAEGLQRPGHERKKCDERDAIALGRVGREPVAEDTGEHAADRGHPPDQRQPEDHADEPLQVEDDGRRHEDGSGEPRLEDAGHPVPLRLPEPDDQEAEGQRHQEDEAQAHDGPDPFPRAVVGLGRRMEQDPADEAVDDAERQSEEGLPRRSEPARVHADDSGPSGPAGKPPL